MYDDIQNALDAVSVALYELTGAISDADDTLGETDAWGEAHRLEQDYIRVRERIDSILWQATCQECSGTGTIEVVQFHEDGTETVVGHEPCTECRAKEGM